MSEDKPGPREYRLRNTTNTVTRIDLLHEPVQAAIGELEKKLGVSCAANGVNWLNVLSAAAEVYQVEHPLDPTHPGWLVARDMATGYAIRENLYDKKGALRVLDQGKPVEKKETTSAPAFGYAHALAGV